MGAWGHGPFENDDAMDWWGSVEDGGVAALASAFSAVEEVGDGYLEVDEACAGLAAAAVVAAVIDGDDVEVWQDARAWLDQHREALRPLRAAARRAVERVFDRSELRELWDENGDDTEWHRSTRALLARLEVRPTGQRL